MAWSKSSNICLMLVAGLLASLFSSAPLQAAGGERLTVSSLVDLAWKREQLSHSGFAWIPKTHTLVYSQVTDVREGSWIYELDLQSGTKRRVRPGEKPVPSPDGRELAFLHPGQEVASARRLIASSGLQLWTSRIDGGDARQVSHLQHGICDFGMVFTWSPDSRHIAYITCAYGSDHQMGTTIKSSPDKPTVVVYPQHNNVSDIWYSVRIVDLITVADRILLNHTGEFNLWNWLDAKKLLFEHDNGKHRNMQSELSAISIADGHIQTVLYGYNPQTDYGPAISAFGSRLAFYADMGIPAIYPERSEIGIAELTTKRVRLLSFTKNFSWRSSPMAWSQDAHWLLYSDGPSTQYELFATDGTLHHQVTFGDGANYDPVFSDDGRYVAWLYDDTEASTSLRVGTWNNGRITSIRELTTLSNPLAGITTGKTSVVRWHSFDGTLIDGYLTLPTSSSVRPYPTIVIVHGGAQGRQRIDTSWPGGVYFVEFLAQHGYAVFEPDYRFSGNFGFNLIELERKRRDLFQENFEDIASGIKVLEKRGIADPKRLYLLGHSWGSNEVNWIITHDTRFRAAVSYEGWDILWDWSSPEGTNTSEEWEFDGSPLTEPAAWAANDAILNARNIRTPTLFVNAENGADSPSLPWLSGASRSMGVDSQYLLYLGEPHGIIQPANQRDLVQRILQWITSH